MSKTYILKPCPFCGSEASIDVIKGVKWNHSKRTGYTEKHLVQCTNPHCVGHHGKPYVDAHIAVEKWNRRVGEPEVVTVNNNCTYTMDDLREMITTAIMAARKE